MRLKVRMTAQRPAALPVPRPLPLRRFVLFRAPYPALLPRRNPAPPALAMAAPAVIRPATVLAGPVATRRVTALAGLAVIRPVLAAPVLAAPVALVARPVLLVAPVPVAPLVALGSRPRLPRPLIPATDRAKRNASRVAALLIFSRAILAAVPMMTTAVV